MQFTPEEIDLEEVIESIEAEEEIANVHHIHIWKLSDHRIHLEAHLDFQKDVRLSESNTIIEELEEKLHDTFEIEHTTFQCEFERDDSKDIIA